MTKQQKKHYRELPTIAGVAFYGAFCGLAIKAIEYGIDDYIVFVDERDNSIHRTRIGYAYGNSDGSAPYFTYGGRRIYFDDTYRI